MGGVSIPIVKFWNLIAGIMKVGAEVVEAKEEDEEEEEKKEKKEKKEKEKEDNKIGVAEKVSTIAMPGAGLLLLFWGLQRGYPLWTCFLAFFLISVL